MEQSRDYDIASLTGKVLLVQETEEDLQAGTLMYVPVYKKNKPTKTVEECRAAILGWVYSPYRMTDLMKGILGHRNTINAARIHLKIYDNDNLTEKSLLFDSQVKYTSEQAKLKYRKVIQPIIFNGKKWTLYFSQPYSLITPFSNRTLIVLIGGVLISFLLAFLSLSLLNSKFRQRIAEKAIASGCDDYITKPIKKNELLKKIEKLLS
jgi:CHASE1-domain containing sensor protein